MDYAAARLNMVESQVRPNRVTDTRIVMAMLELPRENFVPQPLRGVAYVDEDVHIGDGPLPDGADGAGAPDPGCRH